MRHALHTEIQIDAPPEEVWAVLVDLPAHAEWDPFLVGAEGTVAVGQRLRLRMQPPGGKAVTFKPTVTEATPGVAFEWLGRLLVPGLFDGRHRFELHATDGGTRLVQSEAFRGVLVRLLRRSLDERTKAGFEALNEALARRVHDLHSARVETGA